MGGREGGGYQCNEEDEVKEQGRSASDRDVSGVEGGLPPGSPSRPSRSSEDKGKKRKEEASSSSAAPPTQLAEDRETGNVRWSTWTSYMTAAGSPMTITCLILFLVLVQAAISVLSWWFAVWSTSAKEEQSSAMNIGVAMGLAALVFGTSNMRAILFMRRCVAAARHLHHRMLSSVLRAPPSFFDHNPSGRILNRFSRDLGCLDDLMPATAFDFVSIAIHTAGSIIVSGIVNPVGSESNDHWLRGRRRGPAAYAYRPKPSP